MNVTGTVGPGRSAFPAGDKRISEKEYRAAAFHEAVAKINPSAARVVVNKYRDMLKGNAPWLQDLINSPSIISEQSIKVFVMVIGIMAIAGGVLVWVNNYAQPTGSVANNGALPAGSPGYAKLTLPMYHQMGHHPIAHQGVVTVQLYFRDANGKGIPNQTITCKLTKVIFSDRKWQEALSRGLSFYEAEKAGATMVVMETRSAQTDFLGMVQFQFQGLVPERVTADGIVVNQFHPHGIEVDIHDPAGYDISANFAGSSQWQPSDMGGIGVNVYD
jgi:hypothetical protein